MRLAQPIAVPLRHPPTENGRESQDVQLCKGTWEPCALLLPLLILEIWCLPRKKGNGRISNETMVSVKTTATQLYMWKWHLFSLWLMVCGAGRYETRFLHSIVTSIILYIFIYIFIGAGLFSLMTEDGVGEQIFVQVTKKFNEIRQSLASLTSNSSFDEESSDGEGTTPELPPRNYNVQDTLKSATYEEKAKYKTKPKPRISDYETIDEPIPTKSRVKPVRNNNCYEEIECEEEAPKPTEMTMSPSIFNSLIQKHRLKVQHSVSLSSSSSEECVADEALYSVLCNDHSNSKLPLAQNYSQVGPRSAKWEPTSHTIATERELTWSTCQPVVYQSHLSLLSGSYVTKIISLSVNHLYDLFMFFCYIFLFLL